MLRSGALRLRRLAVCRLLVVLLQAVVVLSQIRLSTVVLALTCCRASDGAASAQACLGFVCWRRPVQDKRA